MTQQQVVTIHTYTGTFGTENFSEQEYPVLSAYLNDGYLVKQILPVTTGATSSYMYSLTFVLEKIEY